MGVQFKAFIKEDKGVSDYYYPQNKIFVNWSDGLLEIL